VTRRLYTVTLSLELVVIAETEADAQRVALDVVTSGECMEEPEPTDAAELSYLPGGYDLDCLPYGGDRDETIGELIEQGAAPGYSARMRAARMGT